MLKTIKNKRSFIILLLILSIFTNASFAASKGSGDGSGGGHMYPLTMDSATIRQGATNVSLTPEIKLSFSKNVAHRTVRENNIKSISILDDSKKDIDIIVEIADDQVEPDKRRDIVIRPKNPLNPNSKYTLKVRTSLKSKSDFNLENEMNINFTTGGGASTSGFSDTKNHWAKKQIDQVVRDKLMLGICNTEFAPNKSITRGEMAAILSRTLGLTSRKSLSNIKDYSKGAWYIEDMEKLIDAGIFLLKNGKIAGNDVLNREEIADAFVKAVEYKKIKVNKKSNFNYKDSKNMDPKYVDSVNGAYNLKIMQGRDNKEFAPKSKLTRAEAAVMLLKLRDIIK